MTAKTKKKAVLNGTTVFLSGKGTEQIDGAVKLVLRLNERVNPGKDERRVKVGRAFPDLRKRRKTTGIGAACISEGNGKEDFPKLGGETKTADMGCDVLRDINKKYDKQQRK